MPARFVKIISDRTQRDDEIGQLARDLQHCILLYRKGYFSNNFSECFRLYWTIFDILLSPENSSVPDKHLIPYRVSLMCLGIDHLIKSDAPYTYEQARLWMREDIEDFYTLIRNPLIHDGIEHIPAYERLLERIEKIVRKILWEIIIYIVYLTLPDDFLDHGLKGLLSLLEQKYPDATKISDHIKSE